MAETKSLHHDLVVIDGLIISNFSRAVFEDMRRGGLTAANCTCSVWENFEGTMRNIAGWNRHFSDNADLIMPVRTTADIRRAKELGRTGIILGFQNVSAFEDQLGYVPLFKDCGVGIAQMAYNTQNLYATGCYESSRSRPLRLRPRARRGDEPGRHAVRPVPCRLEVVRGRDPRLQEAGVLLAYLPERAEGAPAQQVRRGNPASSSIAAALSG